jgi:threonine synthase
MTYTDTRDPSVRLDFRTAVVEGMGAKTGGLFVPVSYPALDSAFLDAKPSFAEIAFESAKLFCAGEIPDADLSALVADAYPFDAPLVPLDGRTAILELFHGPTCAFKDFGARFMARAMAYFNRGENEPLRILVATSGDTGSAVGSAFSGVPGIDVTILFPKGKISPLQEKQLSTFTGNVRALRVEGSFDDCQRLVKTAFTDGDVRARMRLSSANSINISRLLPQGFYYLSASLAARDAFPGAKIIAVVPSGNFGNLTSGLIARKMGAPIAGFVCATNANRTIPDWLETGIYRARPSVQTLSNAMDVGNPSNYERMASMYPLEEFRAILAAFSLDDEGTLAAIQACRQDAGYVLDPHGAVGYAAWKDILARGAEQPLRWMPAVADGSAAGIVLETAHPAKFGDTVKKACGVEPEIPERLKKVLALPDRAEDLPGDYGAFKEWLSARS